MRRPVWPSIGRSGTFLALVLRVAATGFLTLRGGTGTAVLRISDAVEAPVEAPVEAGASPVANAGGAPKASIPASKPPTAMLAVMPPVMLAVMPAVMGAGKRITNRLRGFIGARVGSPCVSHW